MTVVTLTARGRAPVATVWRDYVEPQRWSRWAPQVRRATLEEGCSRLAPGVRGKVWGPGRVGIRFRVLDVDEVARRWSWEVGGGPARLRFTHRVAEESDGTSTSLSIEGPLAALPLMLGYAPLARLALRRLVRACPAA